MFQLYLDKLNDECDQLWQRPRRYNLHYTDETWFVNKPLGHDTIQKYMKTLIEDAELTNLKYTNHSIRKTGICTLDENNIKARHVMFLSSHTNESSVRQYATRCPEAKKCQMYGILAKSMGLPPAKTPKISTVSVAPKDNDTEQNQNPPNTNSEPNFDLIFDNMDLFEADLNDTYMINNYLNETEKQLVQYDKQKTDDETVAVQTYSKHTKCGTVTILR